MYSEYNTEGSLVQPSSAHTQMRKLVSLYSGFIYFIYCLYVPKSLLRNCSFFTNTMQIASQNCRVSTSLAFTVTSSSSNMGWCCSAQACSAIAGLSVSLLLVAVWCSFICAVQPFTCTYNPSRKLIHLAQYAQLLFRNLLDSYFLSCYTMQFEHAQWLTCSFASSFKQAVNRFHMRWSLCTTIRSPPETAKDKQMTKQNLESGFWRTGLPFSIQCTRIAFTSGSATFWLTSHFREYPRIC